VQGPAWPGMTQEYIVSPSFSFLSTVLSFCGKIT
jgi:hypothetical protein